MKISFWISATVFYAVSFVLCNSVRVGTVLFTTTDLVKKCWTECDKSLLKARSIMQDVLPDPDCIDFSNPETIMILSEYFHACFQIISTSTYGKIQNLMYIAMSDALGGYLRAYMLPFTKRAYYAGQVKYSEAKKLFQLYDDIKGFLKTNGMGWAKPQKMTFRKVYVTPLPITGGALEACHQLFTLEKPGKLHCFRNNYNFESSYSNQAFVEKNSKEIFKEETSGIARKHSKRFSNFNSTFEPRRSRRNPHKMKRLVENFKKFNLTNFMNNSRDDQNFFGNLKEKISSKKSQNLPEETETPEVRKSRSDSKGPNSSPELGSYKRIIVPLPMLDDYESPHSIAVPFKKRPLRNLRTRSSAFVLEYYYVTVMKCFIAKGNTRSDIKNFNSQFYSWLTSKVYPHLNEEQWYPGFGGVLRVLETIKKFGMDSTVGDPQFKNIGYMFDSGVEFDVTDDKRKEETRNVNEFDEECSYSKRHVLTSIIIVSLIWIFMFCTCAFYCQATRGRRMFYDECYQESTCPQQPAGCPPKNENFVNFQFLVQFFKKRNNPKPPEDAENHLPDCIKHNPPTVQQICHPENILKRKNICERTKKRGISCQVGGDCCTEKIPGSRKHVHQMMNTWPCQPCLVPFDKLEVLNLKQQSEEVPNQIPKNQVQTLWKKPSKKYKKSTICAEGREKKPSKKRYKTTITKTMSEESLEESVPKTYSTSMEEKKKRVQKQSSSCSCSENCCRSYSTTSNTTSNTQVEEKLSSATMEFFEEIISRHKLLKKRSTAEESLDESDSEEEGSLTENNS